MMTEFRQDDHLLRWCAGLPCVDRMSLRAEDERRLRGDALRRTLLGAVCYPLGFLSLFGGIAMLATLPLEALGSPTFFGLAATALFLLTAWLLLVGDESLRRARALRADLRDGYLLRFEGALTEHLPEEPTLALLLARHLLAPAADARQSVEVLPGSHRLLRVNEHPVSGWLTATCTATVPQPEAARTIAQWLDPVDPYDPAVCGGRRELSDEEKVELRDSLRRAWQRPLPLAALLTYWTGVALALCWHTQSWPAGWTAFLLLALLSITLYVDGYVLACLHRAWRLRRDLAQGTVTMIRASDQLTEWLSRSHLPWTINGQPAAWRKE